MRYNVGDKVMLLDHLTYRNTQDMPGSYFSYIEEEMCKLKGYILTISRFERKLNGEYAYELSECESKFRYEEAWLKPAYDGTLKEAHKKKQVTDEQYLDYLLKGIS